MSDIVDENSEISNINLDTEMRQSYLITKDKSTA